MKTVNTLDMSALKGRVVAISPGVAPGIAYLLIGKELARCVIDGENYNESLLKEQLGQIMTWDIYGGFLKDGFTLKETPTAANATGELQVLLANEAKRLESERRELIIVEDFDSVETIRNTYSSLLVEREADIDYVYIAPEPFKRETAKVGRNDPCPCGSGKKHKKCCGK